MAITANTALSYDVVGVTTREDLSDIITNYAPLDTLFYNAIGTGKKPIARKHEFLTESLRAAASNAQIEGDAKTPNAVTAATRLFNNCQIQDEKFLISRSLQEFKSAGDADSVEHKTALHTKYLMKDIEYAFIREVITTGTSTVAPKMAGALNKITSNVENLNGGSVASDGTISGGTPIYVSEDMIKNGMQNAYVAGGNPTVLYCGPFQKRQITKFASFGNYRTMVEDKKLVSSVDVFVMEFGEVQIKTHRNFPTDVIFGCDLRTWKKATLDPIHREDKTSNQDGNLYVIIVEHTLEFLAENANFRVVNLLAA